LRLNTTKLQNTQVCPDCQEATENSFWFDTEWTYQACPCGFMARARLSERPHEPTELKSPGGEWMHHVEWCVRWALDHPEAAL